MTTQSQTPKRRAAQNVKISAQSTCRELLSVLFPETQTATAGEESGTSND